MENTIFFGNGINRLTKNNISWNDLLEQLKNGKKFDNGELPYTMIYERILLEKSKIKQSKINKLEYQIKKEISELLSTQETNRFYSKLIELNFRNYITTNYENTFENTFFKYHKKNGGFFEMNGSEKIYSIRRYIKFVCDKKRIKLWKIHGEISNPKSIMIGLDHYGGYVSKINDYVKGNYRIIKDKKKIRLQSIREKIKVGKFDEISWIELFFNSNIHIIGFGLDYSEIDIWWILNKRARLMNEINIKNKITYYTHKINKEKKELLESLNVKVIEIEVINNNYTEQYEKIFDMINGR